MDLDVKSLRAYAAEFLGTFWLVLGGCGSAVLACVVLNTSYIDSGIGLLGVALAFGLSLLTMFYAIGPISGCHVNPAVTVGVWLCKRIEGTKVVGYIIAQVLGGAAAGGTILAIAIGKPGWSASTHGLATNGWGDAAIWGSPQGYSFYAALIIEVVLTMFFLIVILGVTKKFGITGPAGMAIGFTLTLIHLIAIPVTNTSVNPARSTGVALFAGSSEPLAQLWLFWVAPIAGAILGALVYKYVLTGGKEEAQAA